MRYTMEQPQRWWKWRICTSGSSSPPRGVLPFSLRVCCVLLVGLLARAVSSSQPAAFVTHSNDTLLLNGRAFYFLGANAYYLMEEAAKRDTQTVKALFQTARAMKMTVVRTWGFNDWPDSFYAAVIQYRPGVFNERALRALDYVIYQARLHDIRLLIPLVNNWDDYGGMNQYVRWRAESDSSDTPLAQQRYTPADRMRLIEGGYGRSYRFAINAQFGHDDFYSDPIIRGWFRNYIATILNRLNTITNIRYKDDPYIFGWELANEPRSSDRTAQRVYHWSVEMSSYIKSLDQNHLVGTGEEGFDISPAAYSMSSYNNQHWLFDGSNGVSFTGNNVIQTIDFASCHVYPESWNLSTAAGNVWMEDHRRLAKTAGKPLIVGEFGVRNQKVATYDSWLTTALWDDIAGSMVWQILEGSRGDLQGVGFRCSEEPVLCSHLGEFGEKFMAKSRTGSPARPERVTLQQNYPNPFNGLTTIIYTLPTDAFVELSVYNAIGRQVATVVKGMQAAGERRALLDAASLASGVYFYRLQVGNGQGFGARSFSQTRKLVIIR